jgi:hypothetical protein
MRVGLSLPMEKKQSPEGEQSNFELAGDEIMCKPTVGRGGWTVHRNISCRTQQKHNYGDNALQDDDIILALLHSRMVFVLNKITMHPTTGTARSLRTLPCLVVHNYICHSY